MKAAWAVLGTASDVGKSVVTAGLCRLLSDLGVDVVPFKAQNMANQAAVTRDGLEPGVRMLEAMTGVSVLAVVPHLDHGLDEEDRPLRIPVDTRAPADRLRVGALLAPSVSNTEDLAPLLAESDVHLAWLTDPRLIAEQDLLILPGSKATVADLLHLTVSGMTLAILEAHRRGAWVLGLCGGYQMLGEHLDDRGGTGGGPTSSPPPRGAGAFSASGGAGLKSELRSDFVRPRLLRAATLGGGGPPIYQRRE